MIQIFVFVATIFILKTFSNTQLPEPLWLDADYCELELAKAEI